MTRVLVSGTMHPMFNALGDFQMMQFTTQSKRYHVTSHGNGWAYEVYDTETNDTLWVQDDDACTLQNDTNDFENEEALQQYFECLCE